MSFLRTSPIPCRRLTARAVLPLILAGLLTAAPGSAVWSQQVRLVIDPRTSLAWWEMNPNLSHLWATTCPEDPAWQPGEGRSIGYMVDYLRRQDAVGSSRLDDPSKIPLYPRKVVRSLCTPAVTGELVADDTVTWRGARGSLVLRAEHLITGLDYRDSYARKSIYGTDKHPEIRFQIDSVVNVRRGAGDTLRADVAGVLEIRGVRTPMVIPVHARQDGGGLRVQGKVAVPAADLVEKYGVSAYALGLSVGLRVWKDLYMGVDVVLKPPPSGS